MRQYSRGFTSHMHLLELIQGAEKCSWHSCSRPPISRACDRICPIPICLEKVSFTIKCPSSLLFAASHVYTTIQHLPAFRTINAVNLWGRGVVRVSTIQSAAPVRRTCTPTLIADLLPRDVNEVYKPVSHLAYCKSASMGRI